MEWWNSRQCLYLQKRGIVWKSRSWKSRRRSKLPQFHTHWQEGISFDDYIYCDFSIVHCYWKSLLDRWSRKTLSLQGHSWCCQDWIWQNSCLRDSIDRAIIYRKVECWWWPRCDCHHTYKGACSSGTLILLKATFFYSTLCEMNIGSHRDPRRHIFPHICRHRIQPNSTKLSIRYSKWLELWVSFISYQLD